MQRLPYKLGVDIGGTFTDTVLINEATGEIHIDKVLTTPDDPSRAVITLVHRISDRLNISAGNIGSIIHGTTLVTNAIIERKGAKTGLITTRGFRDILEIGREMRYDIYDLFARMPKPLVPRYLCMVVDERIGPDGNVIKAIDESEVKTVVQRLLDQEVEAMAVSLLHSFRNPRHEQLIQKLIHQINPNMVVSLSSEVVPEIREYERTSTTVANSYVRPLMQHYLKRLTDALQELGFRGMLFMMLSDGGITTAETAAKFPIRIIESGPAGGAIAAQQYGELTGQNDLISFDMGGTTAKICIIEDGQPMKAKDFEAARVYRFKKGSGIPLKVPVIELIEIGAGGGSIAKVNNMGLLVVGPESSGADPGPACYGRGGKDPAVTDADLILGYLDPNYFLGGEMRLDIEAAQEAIMETVGNPMGLPLQEAAWGIHEMVNENMADSAKAYAMEKGIDLMKRAMVVLGGAGPVHAYGIALKLKINKIICPPRAGVLSALGFLAAPASFELSRSYVTVLDGLDIDLVNTIYREMEAEGTRTLEKVGVLPKDISFSRIVGARYLGQGYEIEIPVPGGELKSESIESLRQSFNKQYQRIYNRLNEGMEIEFIDWRVLASGPKPVLNLGGNLSYGSQENAAHKGYRDIFFPETGGYTRASVYDRYGLEVGAVITGPAVVEEKESTLVIGPHGRAEVDAWGNIIVTIDSVKH
ncbi:MAG: hydantoinase/oxoprolinase family protein [Deltaproteobacteria bacterium]|nr:hydantoinase/oxoprolinase family protein [Deltaproteobacteria bacterium]MBW1961141.1 hydantoinase/oxoprolinase family protein [Deltaproteobacteria bacterium]MBW2152943.1 hydantoinase/oxoprolinase family protein [Deltaproteobacteria bacterium]